MPARPPFSAARRLVALLAVAVAVGACLPVPTEPSPSSTPASTAPEPTPTATSEPRETPVPTPAPYSLSEPSATDERRVRLAVSPNLPTDGSGTIQVVVTSLAETRVDELVLRWSTSLDQVLFLAPFTPSSSRTCDGCAPLVQPWTKWVVGPGLRGEPAGTTSLGWGPLDPGATLTIPIVATRRQNGPVSFDLQVLAGEALLTLENGSPGWVRVPVQ